MDLDGYSVPDIGIESAEEIIRTIKDRLDGVVTSDNEMELATALGHETADSGAFRSKISDLKKYGLLEGWGEKSLTPLAHELLEEEQRAVHEIISNIDLFNKAYQEFGYSTPELDEWKEFLDTIGVEYDSGNGAKKAWRRYVDLTRKLPFEENHREVHEDQEVETFDESDFDDYTDMLEEGGNTRELAIRAIKKQVDRPMPTNEPFDIIATFLEDETYPDETAELLSILTSMCKNSNISEESRERAENIALEYLKTPIDLPSEEGIEVKRQALTLLQVLTPKGESPEWAMDLWEVAQRLLRKSVEEEWEVGVPMDDVRDFADYMVKQRLIAGTKWVREDEDLEKIKWDIFEKVDENNLEDAYYEDWLETLGVIK